MSQSLRVKRELREVCRTTTTQQPPRLVDGMPWHSAASHSDVANFRQRQIERGMKPRETK